MVYVLFPGGLFLAVKKMVEAAVMVMVTGAGRLCVLVVHVWR